MGEQITMFNYDCNKPYKITKPSRLIELFAGIGAQAKALENLGIQFEHYRVCEFDKYAAQSYNAIHGTNFNTSDITKIHAADLGITEIDKYEYIMTYSFPCQDLSIAGKQSGMAKGSGTRSGLLWEVERLLKECVELPQVLLMENVPQVLNCDFGGWLDFLDSLGYKNYHKILNAKNFGIPQNRKRCFMVSVLGNYYYEFPKKIPLELRLKDMLESKVDEKYYLSEKAVGRLESAFRVHGIDGIAPACNTCGGGGLETKIAEPTILTPKRTEYGKAIRKDYEAGLHKESRHNFTQLEPKQEHTSNTITTVQKDNLVIEPMILQQPHGFNKGAELEHCPSITTSCWESNNFLKEPIIYGEPYIIFHGNRYKPIHYKTNEDCEIYYITGNERNIGIIKNKNGWFAIRKLTPKECWRLMGFTDSDFDKAKVSGVSNSQLYKQAGNSIVVQVLEHIFEMILKEDKQ